jgi:tripartite-type tricarboxylate transporter receptor subunit TctC
VARAISAPLAAELGQAVVVENRPGAAGTVGLAAVARAKPDGNVLGVLALQSVVAPALIKSLPYDTVRDLAPVRQLSSVSNVLVVPADSPYRSLEDLLGAARAHSVSVASGGNGTPAHLAAELFAQQSGVKLQHVPFNGAVAGVNALLGGHVQMMFATVPAASKLIEAGKLRALASASPERQRSVSGTPTLAESGMPGATMRDWHGMVAPSGTPAERIQQVAAAIEKALASEEVRQRLTAAGIEPAVVSNPRQFGEFVKTEAGRWREVVRQAGIALE